MLALTRAEHMAKLKCPLKIKSMSSKDRRSVEESKEIILQYFQDSDFITSLQSQLESLRFRVKELEDENSKLSYQVLNCHCYKMAGNLSCTVADNAVVHEKTSQLKLDGDNTKSEKRVENIPGNELKLMRFLSKRYVALKVMYFGDRYYGFASEAQMEPTVESEIFRALEKSRLLLGDKKEIHYSRCGRTDKGVSSVGQVISMFLRSNLKVSDNESSRKIVLNEQPEVEIDYVKVLNRVLPKDIRVMGWSPIPIGFSARFSCLSREYKYLFWKENLNLKAMENASEKLVGEHDFRNFCKMDAINVHNYRRHISSFKISPCSKRFESNGLWAIQVRGSAFLWHQVRCMVSVLFMIGQNLETPNVIDALLDIEKTPRKPQYIMAPEMPLVLQSCEFENLNFTCSSDAKNALSDHMKNECRNYELRAAIFHEAMITCASLKHDQSMSSNRLIKKGPSHIPIMSRPSSYEERRAKLNSITCP